MYSCLIITGQHLVNSEIFTFNQSGNNQCSVKFKDNMIFCKRNLDFSIRFTANNLADFLKSFSRNDHFSRLISIFQFDFPDRNSVTIKRNHSENIIVNLKKFSCHHLVRIIISNWKNSLANNFFQSKLGNSNKIFTLNRWKIRKIISWLGCDIKFRFFTSNNRLIVRFCFNNNIIVWKFTDNFWKNLCI